MRPVQIAQRAEDLTRAAAFHTDLLGAAPIATYDPPVVRNSEGNLVGLVEQSTPLARGQATMSA